MLIVHEREVKEGWKRKTECFLAKILMKNVDPKCRVYEIELESSGAFCTLLQCVGSERSIVIGVIKWV